MQIKSGLFKGMIRWSDEAYTVAYTHDTGRAIFGELLKNLYLGRSRYMDEIRLALDFLIETSGSDGARKRRTDITNLNEEKIRELHSKPYLKIPTANSDPNLDCGGHDLIKLPGRKNISIGENSDSKQTRGLLNTIFLIRRTNLSQVF